MRRVDTSSSSLDRMIGEDLPAMLSAAMSKARDEHHPHGPPLPSRHLPLSRSSSMVSLAEHAELESASTSPRGSHDSPPRRTTTNLSRLASDDLFASSSGRDAGEHQEDMRQDMELPVRQGEKIKRTSSLMRVSSIGQGLAESFSNLLSFGTSLTRTPEKASAGLNRRTSIDSNESGGGERSRVSFSSLAQWRERTPSELPRMFSEAGVCPDPADAPTAADVYAAAMSLQEPTTTAAVVRGGGLAKSSSELEASGSAGSVEGRHGGFGGVFNVGSMQSLFSAASNSLKRVPSMKAMPSRELAAAGPTVVFFNLPWAGHAFPTYPLAVRALPLSLSASQLLIMPAPPII